MKKNQTEQDIILTLKYLPSIFNWVELWDKLQDICGTYNKRLNRNKYEISKTTLYKYLNKYCKKLPQGQWEKEF